MSLTGDVDRSRLTEPAELALADALLTAARWILYNNKPRPEEHPKAAHLGP